MAADKRKYGHISRTSQGGGQTWRWLVVGLVCLWGLAVCFWNTGRIATLFGYHSALNSASKPQGWTPGRGNSSTRLTSFI